MNVIPSMPVVRTMLPTAVAPTLVAEPRDRVSIGERPLEKSVESLAGRALVGAMSIPWLTTTTMLSPEERDEIKATLQPGDVLLRNRNGYPLWNVYERAQFGSSDYNHAAMYVGNGRVIEAGPARGTMERSIDGFLDCHQAAVVRPRWRTDEQRESALAYVRAKVGTPYDAFFNHADQDELYCSELVFHALRQGSEPLDVPVHTLLGKEKVGPDAFLRSKDVDVVWSKASSFKANLATHWPMLSFVTMGAAVGAAAGGAAGAALGAVSSLAAGSLCARLIETRH